MFWSGFFIGFFWFHWIALSFIHYQLSYLIPLVILGIGLIYGILFWMIAFITPEPFLRIFGILVFSFIHPFGFNWFLPELPLIHSFYATDLLTFGIFLIGIWLLHVKRFFPLIGIVILIALCFYPSMKKSSLAPLHVKIAKTFVPQDIKWNKAYKDQIIAQDFALISQAIQEGKELIILPESAFPVYLNYEPLLVQKLQKLSFKITILTGALSVKNNKVFNSSYLFERGKVEIADKYILVPFGEEIPLPKFAKNFINKLFFNGAEDYEKAKTAHDFFINGIKFRNAICYEATREELFEDNPKYMIAISNNAWFTPSIEPTLQALLLEYFAKKHQTTIYHSANAGISQIIKP